MQTNEALIEYLIGTGVLHSPAVREAFARVDRKLFVPERLQDFAYSDTALPIGAGQTISQPYVVAFMLELLEAQQGDRVLDVGSGSGYTTALLAAIVGPKGRVFGVEVLPELVRYGQANLAKFHFNNASIRQAKLGPPSTKSDLVLGLPKEAPFDRILVSASAPHIPDALVAQLRTGGRMVLSVEDSVVSATKDIHDRLSIETHRGFVFVPLIEPGTPRS